MPEGSRKRTATVRTIVFSEFRLLRSEEFVRILADYPETRQEIERLAESRMQVLRRKSSSLLSPESDGDKSSTKKNGLICFTINAGIFESHGFDQKINHLASKSSWKAIELYKADYLASKDVNAWLGLYQVV